MLAKGCAICLVLLVVSPVTAPVRTFDLAACGALPAALSGPGGSDPVSVEDATLANDLLVGKSIRFGGIIPLAAAFGIFGAPLPTAATPPVRGSGAAAGRARVSTVLRL